MSHLMSAGDSAIKMTPALEKAVASAGSVSEIQNLMHQAALDQGLVAPDKMDRDGQDWYSYHAVEQPVPQGVAKTLVLNGVKHVLEGTDDADLQQKELELMRSIVGSTTTDPQRDSAGRFVSAADRAALAAVEAQRVAEEERVKQFEVDPVAASLAPSVVAALRAAGIDPDALKEFTQTKQNQTFEKSWETAGEEFQKANPAWPGGTENFNLIAKLISDNNLENSTDKVGALTAAYKHAIEHNLLVEPAEVVEARELSEAQTPDELTNLLRRKGRLASLGTLLGH